MTQNDAFKTCMSCGEKIKTHSFKKCASNIDGLSHYCTGCATRVDLRILESLGSKICKRCNTNVPRTYFRIRGFGHTVSYCKPCEKALSAEREHTEQAKMRRREYNSREERKIARAASQKRMYSEITDSRVLKELSRSLGMSASELRSLPGFQNILETTRIVLRIRKMSRDEARGILESRPPKIISKTCLKCGNNKDAGCFSSNPANIDNRNHYCIDCASKFPLKELILLGEKICSGCNNVFQRSSFGFHEKGKTCRPSLYGACKPCREIAAKQKYQIKKLQLELCKQ